MPANNSSLFQQRLNGESSPSLSIYLDYNATTPLHPQVTSKITASLSSEWQNPSSAYGACNAIRASVTRARRQIGYAIGLLPEAAIDRSANGSSVEIDAAVERTDFLPESIIFTSGGSESNNWAVDIAIKHAINRLSTELSFPERCHIIATTVEHDSIARKLSHGIDHYKIPVDVTLVPPKTNSTTNLNGTFSVDDFVSAILDDTVLITCIFAQNETGLIQPISELAEKLGKINEDRKSRKLPRIFFHTDASQAIGKIPVNLNTNFAGVDMLTICGHKFNGPRIGALFLRPHTVLSVAEPFVYGGMSQEFGLRAGTQNTPMIVGLGEAAYIARKHLNECAENMLKTRNLLLQQLTMRFPKKSFVHANFNPDDGYAVLPNTLSVALPSLVGECVDESVPPSQVMQQRLAARGIFCSTGSACHAGAATPSRVLIESGVSLRNALSTLRLSVGPLTTADEVTDAARVIAEELATILSSR